MNDSEQAASLCSPQQTSASSATPPGLPEDLAAEAGRYWSGSSSVPWVRDMSHWRGQGRWSDEQAWLAIGQRHVQMFHDLCLLARLPRPVQSMLEWGPGGGANAVAFARQIPEFWGVDISAANLQECGRQVAAAGLGGWHPVLVDAACPQRVLELVPRPVDFVLCTAVFQHFPGKQYGVDVMHIAHRLLASPGIALIQIRYDDGSEALRPKQSEYARNVVTFTSYRIEEFWQIAGQTGFEPLSVVLWPEARYAFYWLRKG